MTRHGRFDRDEDEPGGVPLIPFLLLVWVPLMALSITIAVVIASKP